MLGTLFKSKNSVISRGNAGTLGNSGRSSTRTGSGSISEPQSGPNSSGNNILSSGSSKKKSNKNPVASRTGNPSADRILGNSPDLPELPAGRIQAQARSVRKLREEAARRAEAEGARHSKVRMPSGIKRWDPSPACSPLYIRLRDFILRLRNLPHLGENRVR